MEYRPVTHAIHDASNDDTDVPRSHPIIMETTDMAQVWHMFMRVSRRIRLPMNVMLFEGVINDAPQISIVRV